MTQAALDALPRPTPNCGLHRVEEATIPERATPRTLTVTRERPFTITPPKPRFYGHFGWKIVEQGLLERARGGKDGPPRTWCVLVRERSVQASMSLRTLSSFLVLAGLATLIGCGGDEPRGTEGQLGTLRFEYATTGACSGCDVDREVLVGSLLDVDMHGISPRVHVQVRSTSPEVAEFRLTSRCRFIGHEGCRDATAVITKTAGDADLEVFDDWTGTVLDRVTIKVRDAASLETTVKATPSRGGEAKPVGPAFDGIFELEVDSDVEIVTTARSASGDSLIATSAAINGAYGDEHVLGPRPAFGGAAPTEYAKAKSPGVATVAVVGGGARRELLFRVLQ